jgi:hypothetical protein
MCLIRPEVGTDAEALGHMQKELKSAGVTYEKNEEKLSHIRRSPTLCSSRRMLTYADVCRRMLTYADVC